MNGDFEYRPDFDTVVDPRAAQEMLWIIFSFWLVFLLVMLSIWWWERRE